jgi:hypothetical protein
MTQEVGTIALQEGPTREYDRWSMGATVQVEDGKVALGPYRFCRDEAPLVARLILAAAQRIPK